MNWKKAGSTINTWVPTIMIVVTAGVGIWQYSDAQQFEAARPFLQKQLDLCIEASDAAAALATAAQPGPVTAAMERFWQLYYGSLHIVEDTGTESVAARMVTFGDTLKKLPADPVTLAAIGRDQRKLDIPSLDIAKACRKLIEKNWKSVVPQLREG